jgi:hypothetical protein
MRSRGILCGLVLTMTTLSAGAEDKITMNATPQISFAPATVIVRTRIEPDPGNRAMEIAVDSPDFYRSTTVELEGDQAPRTSVFEFHGIPGGTYEVSAKLLGVSGNARGLVRKQIDVLKTGREK